MAADAGVPLKELRVDGGACRNDFLMQFQSDLLRVRVDRPERIETTALGAAFLAGLGAGIWKDPAEIRHLRRTERVFDPQGSREQVDRLHAGWRDAVSRVRSKR